MIILSLVLGIIIITSIQNEQSASDSSAAGGTGGLDCDTNTDSCATVKTNNANLNLRSQPNTSSSVIAKMTPGSIHKAIGKSSDGSWIALCANGQAGWASASYLTLSNPGRIKVMQTPHECGEDSSEDNSPNIEGCSTVNASVCGKVVNTNGANLNMRSEPKGSSSILFKLPASTTYPILGISTDEDWYAICANDKPGWVSISFIEVTPQNTSLTQLTNTPTTCTGGTIPTTSNTTSSSNSTHSTANSGGSSNTGVCNIGVNFANWANYVSNSSITQASNIGYEYGLIIHDKNNTNFTSEQGTVEKLNTLCDSGIVPILRTCVGEENCHFSTGTDMANYINTITGKTTCNSMYVICGHNEPTNELVSMPSVADRMRYEGKFAKACISAINKRGGKVKVTTPAFNITYNDGTNTPVSTLNSFISTHGSNFSQYDCLAVNTYSFSGGKTAGQFIKDIRTIGALTNIPICVTEAGYVTGSSGGSRPSGTSDNTLIKNAIDSIKNEGNIKFILGYNWLNTNIDWANFSLPDGGASVVGNYCAGTTSSSVSSSGNGGTGSNNNNTACSTTNIQFEYGSITSWLTGEDITSSNIAAPVQNFHINCFSNFGKNLLDGGTIKINGPGLNGTFNSPEARNISIPIGGTYTASCLLRNNVCDTENFTISRGDTSSLPNCGSLDADGDSRLSLFDLGEFAKVYNTACVNASTNNTCGPKDVNNDNFIGLADLSKFALYFNKDNCKALIEDQTQNFPERGESIDLFNIIWTAWQRS